MRCMSVLHNVVLCRAHAQEYTGIRPDQNLVLPMTYFLQLPTTALFCGLSGQAQGKHTMQHIFSLE